MEVKRKERMCCFFMENSDGLFRKYGMKEKCLFAVSSNVNNDSQQALKNNVCDKHKT